MKVLLKEKEMSVITQRKNISVYEISFSVLKSRNNPDLFIIFDPTHSTLPPLKNISASIHLV